MSTRQVFISYRRVGGSDFASRLKDALERRGFKVFLDIEDLRSGPFNAAIYREIEDSIDVLVVLSPGSLDRTREDDPLEDWMRLEVAYALKLNKNVVPILMPGFTWPSHKLPSDVAELPTRNGLSHSYELFHASIDKLASKLLHSLPSPPPSPPHPPHILPWIISLVLVVIASAAGWRWYVISRRPERSPPIRQMIVTPDDIADPWGETRNPMKRSGGLSSANSDALDRAEPEAGSSGESRVLGDNITARQGLDRAIAAAEMWDANSTLRQVVANSWEKYRRNDGTGPTFILKVVSWRYMFFAGERGLDVIISGQDLQTEPAGPNASFLAKLPPLDGWVLDAQGAFGAAMAAGAGLTENNNFPPTLSTHTVKGKATPVWVVPCTPTGRGGSTLVDAQSGLLVDPSDIARGN